MTPFQEGFFQRCVEVGLTQDQCAPFLKQAQTLPGMGIGAGLGGIGGALLGQHLTKTPGWGALGGASVGSLLGGGIGAALEDQKMKEDKAKGEYMKTLLAGEAALSPLYFL